MYENDYECNIEGWLVKMELYLKRFDTTQWVTVTLFHLTNRMVNAVGEVKQYTGTDGFNKLKKILISYYGKKNLNQTADTP